MIMKILILLFVIMSEPLPVFILYLLFWGLFSKLGIVWNLALSVLGLSLFLFLFSVK